MPCFTAILIAMKKLINLDDIKIEHRTLLALQEHCREYRLDAEKLFIYFENEGIHVGFGPDKDFHIKIPDSSWLPSKSASKGNTNLAH